MNESVCIAYLKVNKTAISTFEPNLSDCLRQREPNILNDLNGMSDLYIVSLHSCISPSLSLLLPPSVSQFELSPSTGTSQCVWL
ncbi:hypothetical protein QQF64_005820 [Cirrhinus molitorella]|uniref:Uncharacterized protein n=1 Tax=Cirrhinus molitorella TaxID=172907 RepID=A0ABR3MFL8_9TELE